MQLRLFRTELSEIGEGSEQAAFRKNLFRRERRIESIIVFAVKSVQNMLNAFAEALIMHNFSLPQELYGVAHVGVVAQQKNIVIGNARLLLCCNHIRTTCD